MKFNLETDNINYIKITYQDKEGFAHCIKTAVKFLNDFEILTSAKTDEDILIPFPQEVELGFACINGLYTAKTNLINIERQKNYLLFSIRKPEEMEYQQKREYFRVKIQENAVIIYQNEDEKYTKIPLLTYDISAKGVRLELEQKMIFPEFVTIVIYLDQKQITAKAKYVRFDEEDKILKASFQFTEISPSDLDYISRICFKKQLEEKRKGFV